VAEGPEVETDWHNFEASEHAQAHPPRSGFDTLYLNLGEPVGADPDTHVPGQI